MADTLQRASGTIATTRATVYTTPASTKFVVRHVGFINTTAADVTVKLWIHNVLYEPGVVVPALDTRAVDVSMWLLKATELLEAEATATGVSIVVHGVEVT